MIGSASLGAVEPHAAAADASILRRLFPTALGLLFGAYTAFDIRTLNDGDTFSHVRTGLWILQHQSVPQTDIFSNSVRGAPWTAHEWLSEVLLSIAFNSGGWAGVLALTGICAGAAAYLLSRTVSRALDGLAMVAISVLGAACFESGLLARPHVLALPILVAWTAHLLDARHRVRAPSLPYVGALMLLWANLHGGWAFGLALLGLLTAERICLAPGGARARVQSSSGWIAALAVAAAAAIATPNGLEGLLFPLKLSLQSNISQISEWQSADFSHIGLLEIILLALFGMGLTGRWTFDGLTVLIMCVLIHLALQHQRHLILLGSVGAILLAYALGPSTAETPPPGPASPDGRRLQRRIAAFGLVTAALATAARLAAPVSLADSRVAAPTALQHAPPAVRALRVFNSYEFGGFLIFEGVPPFIDGRADMFGRAFMDDYVAALGAQSGRFNDYAARHHIGWTLLRPSEPLVRVLDRDPAWRRIYADSFAVIHKRAPGR